MDRPPPGRMPKPMHPIADSIENEQEHDQLETEGKCLPAPIGVVRKRDLVRHLCGEDEKDLVRGEGCHIRQEHLKILDWTCGPTILRREKEQANSPIDGDPFLRKRISKRVEHCCDLGHVS